MVPLPDHSVVSLELPPSPRVLIVMMSAVGDAVHTLPVIAALKRHDPGSRISWVLQPGPASLVEGHPDVDEVIPFDRKRGWRAFLDVRRRLAGRDFDMVIALQVYFKASVVVSFARAPVKLGFDRTRARDLNWLFTTHRIPRREPQHVQDQYFEFLAHLGVSPHPIEWKLGPTAEEVERYEGILAGVRRPLVALVVGTSKPSKEWPAQRYAELVDRLAARGISTMMVGGRSDRELAAAETVRRLARNPPLDMLEWDLRKVVYLIDQADVLVSPDTGPLHIGVALGTPSVALMGYTNPKRVGPYRRFRELLVDAYGEPGEDYPVEARYRHNRMERIGVDEVMEKVELALARYAGDSLKGQFAP
jgi:heptosyltransferase I